MALKIGDSAPDFNVVASNGKRLALRELRGSKNVVLYFYPKDFTAVCTRETCGFRDMYADLQGKDTEVIGVSFDDNETHERFAKEHNVPFALVADTERTLATAYGAVSFFRSLLNAPTRVTFLIDKEGKIAGIYKAELSASTHVEGVKEGLARLSA
jgi:peroxiredoxin Q/BCP